MYGCNYLSVLFPFFFHFFFVSFEGSERSSWQRSHFHDHWKTISRSGACRLQSCGIRRHFTAVAGRPGRAFRVFPFCPDFPTAETLLFASLFSFFFAPFDRLGVWEGSPCCSRRKGEKKAQPLSHSLSPTATQPHSHTQISCSFSRVDVTVVLHRK